MLDTTDELAFEVEFLSCVVDKKNDLLILDADSHFCDFVGIHPSKIKQGKLKLIDLMIPQNRQEIMEKLFKKSSPYVYLNLYILDKTGRYNHVHCTARNNENDSLCQITFADVGRSIEKSKKLNETAKTMNNLIELVTGGVCLFKVDQNMRFEIKYANAACCKFFGTTKENIDKQIYRIDDLIHPEDKSIAFQKIGSAMATQKPVEMEIRILTHKDEFMWVKINCAIQKYDDENCPIFHAMITDITEIKKAESEANLQREMLTKTFKKMPGPIFYTSIEQPLRLAIVSDDLLRLLGYTRSEMFGDMDGDLTKIIAPNDVKRAKGEIKKQLDKDGSIVCEYSVKTKSGEYITVSDKRRIIELDSGEKSMVCRLKDVSAQNVESFIHL